MSPLLVLRGIGLDFGKTSSRGWGKFKWFTQETKNGGELSTSDLWKALAWSGLSLAGVVGWVGRVWLTRVWYPHEKEESKPSELCVQMRKALEITFHNEWIKE